MTYRQQRLQTRQWQRHLATAYACSDFGLDFLDSVEDDPHFGEDHDTCHYCGGDGFGIVGTDWDSDDPINGPYDGEVEVCPCCGGTGNAKDCTFW